MTTTPPDPESTPDDGESTPDADEARRKAAEAYGAVAPDAPVQADGDATAPLTEPGLPSPDPIDQEFAELLDRQPGEDPRSKEQLVADLDEAGAKLTETQDDLLRMRAEFANFKRRTERDAMQGRIAGRADVLDSLLDVLDDFDRTVVAAEESPDDALRAGITMVRGKLVGALEQHGLTRIDEVGVPFDPNRHEAVQTVQSPDGPLETERVQTVFRPGYLHGDRVLRAAMVVVEQ